MWIGQGANAWLIKPIWQWRLSGKFDWHHINVSSASQSQGDYLLKFEIFLPYLFSYLAAYKSCIETNLEDCSDDQKREFDYNYNINEEGYLNELKGINDVQTRCAETPCDPNPCQNGGACTSQVSTSLLRRYSVIQMTPSSTSTSIPTSVASTEFRNGRKFLLEAKLDLGLVYIRAKAKATSLLIGS